MHYVHVECSNKHPGRKTSVHEKSSVQCQKKEGANRCTCTYIYVHVGMYMCVCSSITTYTCIIILTCTSIRTYTYMHAQEIQCFIVYERIQLLKPCASYTLEELLVRIPQTKLKF